MDKSVFAFAAPHGLYGGIRFGNLGCQMTDSMEVNMVTPQAILAMGDKEAATFVETQLRERCLNKTVSELNRLCLDGSKEEKRRAQQALKRLGFL